MKLKIELKKMINSFSSSNKKDEGIFSVIFSQRFKFMRNNFIMQSTYRSATAHALEMHRKFDVSWHLMICKCHVRPATHL